LSDFFEQWEHWLERIEPDEATEPASQTARQSKDEAERGRAPSDALEEPAGS